MTSDRRIVIGADTHLDTIHLAAITDTGQLLSDAEFRTNPTGYWAAICWARSLGEVVSAGVEGTSSYGAGFTQALQANNIHVVEVNRPDRSARRRQGKSDPLDAHSAARAVLAGHGLAVPKDPHTGALKALLVARRGDQSPHRGHSADQRPPRHRSCRVARALPPLPDHPATGRSVGTLPPTAHEDPTTVSVLTACKTLAQRIEFLERQDRDLTAELDSLTSKLNPALRAAYGVGPDTAAQLLITAGTNAHRLRSEAAFAMLAGAAPIPASSGKTTRHRLSRGGDRAANNALHRIALVRWSHDPRTRDYTACQLAAGRSKKDILRLLKRAIAREMFRHLTAPCPIDDYSDLRPARQAKNITLSAVANHFGVWPNDISRLERGLKRDDTLAADYRRWLNLKPPMGRRGDWLSL
ncbi:transposase [Mycobacterium bourgelatii]|uniref:transposase n=1 Tax=Mycobacterium bourgelatii TaxID=1273442 RepID=UPI001F0812F5|nr:transposase [Mycobacterium bourgelatii]